LQRRRTAPKLGKQDAELSDGSAKHVDQRDDQERTKQVLVALRSEIVWVPSGNGLVVTSRLI